MIPKNITKEHVILAIEDIENNGLRNPLGKSSVYDLAYNGKKYPPKHTVIVANEYANGELLHPTSLTTDGAQRFLRNLGEEFQIEQKDNDPVKIMIENYKEDLIEKGLADEIYKWEMLARYGGRPNTDDPNFGEDIRAIDYRNLVFHNGLAVRNHIVIDNSEPYRQAFIQLFDENVGLKERILDFQDKIETIYRPMVEKLSHHHDERSIATFLTVKYPTKYVFYKSSFYTKYCKMLGVKTKKKNDKYIHYLELIDDLIGRYIQPDEELLEMIKEKLPAEVYQDENHKLLAQDILFKMLDKNEITFKSIIEDLKIAMADEDSILKDFTFDNVNFKDKGLKGKKDSYVWIRDAQGQIGNVDAHYEVSIRSRGDMKNCFFVDVHFEGKDKNKYQNLIGNLLPVELEWIPWQKSNSVGHKNGIDPNDTDVVEKIIEQLLYIENNIGDRIRQVMPLLYDEMEDKNEMMHEELNQILYGPPGTGKTYHTIDKALKIIDRNFYDANMGNRNLLTSRFKELLIKDFDNTKGQIAFCTFHQSMAYEDFIEGIKPVAPKGIEDAVNYRVADGLFKKLCLEAAKTKSASGLDEGSEKIIDDVLENNSDHDNSKKNYVLIIDEINRGNVSQIFGELITLIENNKRAGEKEELEIILPYSTSSFTVPKNLYIIGTMNTADRSVEALDTALRRRFSFEKMPSNPSLLTSQRLIWQLWWTYEDKDWQDPVFLEKETALYRLIGADELSEMTVRQKDLIWKKIREDYASEAIFDSYTFTGFDFRLFLEKVNARLEKLLSSDHTIGHSYFMAVYSMADLESVLYNKVIPLLQEYFYGDLGKIGLVLGRGFIRVKKQVNYGLFADFEYDKEGLDEKEIYEILDYRKCKSFDIEIKNNNTQVTFNVAIDMLLGEKM